MFFVTIQRVTISRGGLISKIKGFDRFLSTFKNQNHVLVSNRLIDFGPKTFLHNSFLTPKYQRNIFTCTYSRLNSVKGIQENISALHMKKRPLRKKRSVTEDEETALPGVSSLSNFILIYIHRTIDFLFKILFRSFGTSNPSPPPKNTISNP